MSLAQACQQHGVPLIVDEAHGSHLSLHPELPPSALQQGADIVVQSTHKTLGALTQAAMLHVGHEARHGFEAATKRHLNVLQSSSPSYLLMASLEAAVEEAAHASVWDKPLAAAQQLCNHLEAAGLPVLRVDDASCSAAQTRVRRDAHSDDPASHPAAASAAAGGESSSAGRQTRAVAAIDPLRVTCLCTRWQMSGCELHEQLMQHNVFPELATPQAVVFALGIGSQASDAEATGAALQRICAQGDGDCCSAGPEQDTRADWRQGVGMQRSTSLQGAAEDRPSATVSDMPGTQSSTLAAVAELYDMRAALHAPAEQVSWRRALGKRSAALVSVYPPGIPALVLGQRITEATVATLQECVANGGSIVGCSSDLSGMHVVAQ